MEQFIELGRIFQHLRHWFAGIGSMCYNGFMIKKLTEAECRAAMESGDFDPAMLKGPAAAIILTQSWCPQWKAMKSYLPKAEEAVRALYGEISIYYIEYDIEPWESLENDAFMRFKENTYNNREIPYVRYYRDGVYARDSNYISLDGFINRLQ